jgi:hypothetical protein
MLQTNREYLPPASTIELGVGVEYLMEEEGVLCQILRAQNV